MRMSEMGSIVMLSLCVAACAVEPTPEPAVRAPATEATVQAVLDPCLDACRRELMACIRDCARDPSGSTDCGCASDNASCQISCPNGDFDADGVLNGVDNCAENANTNQADCDADGAGDVCDGANYNYQAVTSDHTCWTDKDTHLPWLDITFELHVQHQERDVSNCHAPDRWIGRNAADETCNGVSDSVCCHRLDFDIRRFGDDPALWCGGNRDRNLCH